MTNTKISDQRTVPSVVKSKEVETGKEAGRAIQNFYRDVKV